jgi:hypothetical protein
MKIQLFYRIFNWFCLISNLSQTCFDGPRHYEEASPTHSCLTVNLYFGPSFRLTKFGHGVFPHSVYVAWHSRSWYLELLRPLGWCVLYFFWMLNMFLVCLTSSWMKPFNFSLSVCFYVPYWTVYSFFATASIIFFCVCVCGRACIKPTKYQYLMAEIL